MNNYMVNYLGNIYSGLIRVLGWDLAILADNPDSDKRERCITVCNQVLSHYESDYLGYDVF